MSMKLCRSIHTVSLFLVAVHCDITVWLYVSHGVQIEAFIYSRLKGHEICQRALLSPPLRSPYLTTRPQICLFENFARHGVPALSVSFTLNHSQRVLCAFCSL